MIDDVCAARKAYVRLIDTSVLLLTVTTILKTLKFRGFDEKGICALGTFAAGKSLIGMNAVSLLRCRDCRQLMCGSAPV
ncbi:hypothetical protein OZX67_08070 [Bifidobacterium sp. ESL0728]|uniref:hypothetical protein n=1 Tax=Bifidobacterium sp. ESL0728 TaxID=2983220 RepID=UPI0023F7477E|nr:hypothetical protein [Bifidobacterium sp. ESL0728]WEV58739.1 hypothetical protein OZX67_08070 [Bifidobacterium sp. ESL0728]